MAKRLVKHSSPKPKSILFLTYYFPPDLSAGSFRASGILDSLPMNNEVIVRVLTTEPNRYASYAPDVLLTESSNNFHIDRIPVPKIGFGVLGQVWAFLFYGFHVLRMVRNSNFELVFATSSRLMTAVLGAFISRNKACPLYLDVRDLLADVYPETVSPVLRPLLRLLLRLLEGWAFRQATKVNLNSPGFVDYFAQNYPNIAYSTYTNGIDDIFMRKSESSFSKRRTQTTLRILYAGNVGEGQGLEGVVPKLAARMNGQAHFIVIGDGGKRSALVAAVKEAGLSNVEFGDPVERSQLVDFYRHADVLFLHLNDKAPFKKVLPSKIFEYAATGKPIWAGLIGYSAAFVQSEVKNAAVFPSGDIDAAVDALGTILVGHTDRQVFIKKYSRKYISQCMARDVLSIIE